MVYEPYQPHYCNNQNQPKACWNRPKRVWSWPFSKSSVTNSKPMKGNQISEPWGMSCVGWAVYIWRVQFPKDLFFCDPLLRHLTPTIRYHNRFIGTKQSNANESLMLKSSLTCNPLRHSRIVRVHKRCRLCAPRGNRFWWRFLNHYCWITLDASFDTQYQLIL